MNATLEFEKVTKKYQSAENELTVLKNFSIRFEPGSTTALMGPSGSGKTTLLGLAAGLDRPTEGAIKLFGEDISKKSENEIAAIRSKKIGFVFQSFHLISSLTALENIEIPGELLGDKAMKGRARELLDRVGLSERAHHFPTQLSGGEQQRVALARAYANSPQLLLADEPTGSLDADNSEKVLELLFSLNREMGTTLLIATHDSELAKRCARVIRLEKGSLVGES